MKYYIAIPTYNGGDLWRTTVDSIKQNTPPNTFVHVIDSGSKDDTASLALENDFDVISIQSSAFNHGGTRNEAINNYIDDYDVVIFLTQDAIPAPGFIEGIITAFQDEKIVCAYGRQLPHSDANPLAQHARAFNYPDKGYIACKEKISTMGLKAAFMSNSFSAYRLSAFKELGGFPSNTILCEDMFYTAKAILAGYKVAYVPEAKVYHSHNYTPIEEFKRYFDIGVFHTDEPWIRNSFGGAGGEGKRFIISEFNFLLKKYPYWIPVSFLYNVMKFIGFKTGKSYKLLPKILIKNFSMHKRFWGF
ncbi:TPA: glycosyltransferase family 2 protein [Klebsiella oxytoca]|uniref:glycosyltransferase family 2 protein n=1 Tax=Klebsiella oxytoca TaxID=571 RepID=UPI00191E0046|nr:glycosyltransferase [Klebsiella oxytoca]MBL0806025.1 glycosyltransferase family 2 protein [Klebsiella oxytoca]HBM2883476.1 glycosyltransferase family 2 protein [Klebsiella oxytoca]HCK0929907.1 glycosyltransferase family 2 protein [Klebsiella oxytoca]HDS6518841.1 glycosyltransferase family 2 protein [Klebsiella oxytoca]HDT4988302.1 glycosyltransferase family 2 protein [Klebsiella oxytoca]